MQKAQLMAVVEVPPERRILCQREGCGHSVYKRIHVVLDNGSFTILGSECFQKIYEESGSDAAPRYGSSAGQLLSDDERRMLMDNTSRFIAMLEAQRVETERQGEQHSNARQQAQEAVQRAASLMRDADRDAQMAAMDNCRRLHPGLNLTTPGWQGLVYLEKLRLLRLGQSNEVGTQTGASLF